uniref:G-protein coupled receptors family 1 profile domain-containing protein n=1 Tax=Nomascus leucogenys TaxID=61853 RepID=A0A2I3H7G8_NOMLE
MKRANHTELREFVFQGFSNFQEHQLTYFVVFLALYILTLASNFIILAIIYVDHHLHTPIYFFLSVLSTSETFYSLVIIPRLLSSLVGLSQSISLEGSGTQIFFFLGFAITNCLLLAVMGYDHYVAICNPLRYPVIMNWRVCAILASSICATGFPLSLVQTVAIFRMPFSSFHAAPATFLFISYVIISTILKIASAEGWKKTFATCASHFTVVIIHYGCAYIAYFKPKLENTKDQDQLISVTYTVITPLLNPVVYSLRNKEVQDALLRVLVRKFFS